MREGDRVMLVADFERTACDTIPAGTFGLLGTCEGNLCHVLFDGTGPAIVPMSLLEKHHAEPEANDLEFEEDVSTWDRRTIRVPNKLHSSVFGMLLHFVNPSKNLTTSCGK